MTPGPEATRLLSPVDSDDLAELAAEPGLAVGALFGITVEARAPSPPGAGCPIDATYNPGPPPIIRVADDVGPTRWRFSVLHELGHHLIEHDDYLNNLPIPDDERHDEEICNEVAASVLIPDAVVHQVLVPGRITAAAVAELHHAVTASRAACCVAAVRHLRFPGCVILARPDGTAVFVAHHPATRWRIARGTPQGEDSIVARAARSSTGRARGITQARFARGNLIGDVYGDAVVEVDGWVFAVLVADSHSPWETGLNLGLKDTGPEAVVVDCLRCGETNETWQAPCPKCRDWFCPACGRCSCGPTGEQDKCCRGCWLMKPPNQFEGADDLCVDRR